MPTVHFSPIKPAPDTDIFVFDFTSEIGTVSGDVMASVLWTCTVSPSSLVADPTPNARIVGSPIFDDFETSALCGNMIAGAIYILTARATTVQNRIITKDGDIECISLAPALVPITAGTAQFDYDAWITRYPEFNGVGPVVAQSFWNEASLILRNDPSSPVQDIPTRTILLYMLMAHLAATFAGPGSTTGMVGRINSKSVNGVSVSSEGFGVTGTQAWFLTTRYGANYWRATAGLRTMRYVPGPQRSFELPFRGIGRIFPWS
jgi:hypothetical protein